MSYVIPTKNRLLAFEKQKGRCYYCGVPMWLDNLSEFTAKYGISEKKAKHFACTAEHLLARQDGGTNEMQNIVAACYFCNSRRHRALTVLPSEKYRERVMDRLRRQKWHPIEYHHML